MQIEDSFLLMVEVLHSLDVYFTKKRIFHHNTMLDSLTVEVINGESNVGKDSIQQCRVPPRHSAMFHRDHLARVAQAKPPPPQDQVHH